MSTEKQEIESICVHAGRRDGNAGVVNAVQPSTAYQYLDEGEQPYPRYFNTPNQEIVVEKLCSLENASAGAIFASGMSAISTTLLTLARTGDHVVFQRSLYGGTYAFATKEYRHSGVDVTFADCEVSSIVDAIRPNTKLIYVETPANPLLDVVDLKRLTEAAKARGVITIADNTFATPINQNPLKLGVDVVIHSGTKYLGGHSDLCFGAVLSREELMQPIREKALLLGGNVNALTCYLAERSLKTLAIRVRQQNRNALRVAEFLEAHALVKRVDYPGLPTHPRHDVAASQMSGFGGMLSFELVDSVCPKTLVRTLRLITPAMSLGGVESTATIPYETSHKPIPVEERLELGVTDKLIRLSIGIEAEEDLVADLDQALGAMIDSKGAV
ncbi:MAG: aminotransferase class I/II-fold pyridoxal phosphate-dependent enzyme [Planctomycetota bacterium]